MPKPNPVLEAYKRKLDAQYKAQLEIGNELNLIASLIAANDVLHCGPGRAEKFQNAQVATLNAILRELVEDAEDDAELAYTKHDLRTRMQAILGGEVFKKHASRLYKLLLED